MTQWWSHYYVKTTSRRRFDIIMTLLLRRMSPGLCEKFLQSHGTVRCGHAPFNLFILLHLFRAKLSYTVYPKKYAHGFCFAVLCCGYTLSDFPISIRFHWHCGNLTIAPVQAKQPWWIWINTSCELIMNDCITTTKQSTTNPCAYFLGYTVYIKETAGRKSNRHMIHQYQVTVKFSSPCSTARSS